MADIGLSAVRRPRFLRSWLVLALVAFTAATLVAWRQDPYPNAFLASSKSWVEWLIYPLESNAPERLPTYEARFNSVALSADGQRGWAVGDGVILRTFDGGRNWTRLKLGADSNFQSVASSADGLRVWIAGFEGLFSTTDGGRNWLHHGMPISGASSMAMSADGRRGLLANDSLYWTSDGGLTWVEKQSAPGIANIFDAVALSSDGEHGCAVNGNIIVVTADGGRTWSRSRLGEARLTSLAISDDGLHIIGTSDLKPGDAFSTGSSIWRSDDGGRNWTRNQLEAQSVNSVAISRDGLTTWAAGIGIRSHFNGSSDWVSARLGVGSAITAIAMAADGAHGVAVGEIGQLFFTSDGGRRWLPMTNGLNAALISVSVSADRQYQRILSPGGALLSSSNGGNSWTRKTLAGDSIFLSLASSQDAMRSWVAGFDGILVSTDRGRSWTHARADQKLITAAAMSGDGQRGWFGGPNGIFATVDAGQSWTRQNAARMAVQSAMAISLDGRLGWTVAQEKLLTTDDGGRRWTPTTVPGLSSVFAVAMSPAGNHVVVVGRGNYEPKIATTQDGGRNWITAPSSFELEDSRIAISHDGQRDWLIADGRLLSSSDGGRSWHGRELNFPTEIANIAAPDGSHATLVGTGRTILQTADGGGHWQRVPWPFHYHRYPAPWYWLVLLLCIALPLIREIRGAGSEENSQGAAAIAASDSPTINAKQDRLDFLPLARGISRFLRNERTEPPLTLAVTGDWGSGKSSLMGLVCADLAKHGLRPIWFNAWHHQQEEQRLAALLVAIRDRGLPPLFTPRGLAFRARLLWIRSRNHYLAALCLCGVASLLLGYLLTHNLHEWDKLWKFLGSLVPSKGGIDWHILFNSMALPPLLMQLVSGATVIVGLRRGLKAFGADPAQLLGATVERARLRDASAQVSFRLRFARQFAEVTEALPYRMVIVIDDLDRCRPETVLDVMESVNFLMSSGRCCVVFGMAKARVQAALALSFKDIAKELVELDVDVPVTVGDADREVAERQRRLVYAQQYLEKLINIEIVVPDRRDLAVGRLLSAESDGAMARGERLFAGVRKLLILAPFIAVIAFGILSGEPFSNWLVGRPAQVAEIAATAPAAAGPAVPSAPVTQSNPVTPLPVPQKTNSSTFSFEAGDTSDSGFWFLGALASILIAGGALLVLRLRREVNEVKDSRDFLEALAIWTPIAAMRNASPRAIKRFGNRLRYLAMLQQAESLDVELSDVARNRVRQWLAIIRRLMRLRPKQVEPERARALSVAEHRIVALGALQEAVGDRWRKIAVAWNKPYGPGSGYLGREDPDFREQIEEAIEQYKARTRSTWPPRAEELDAFEQALKGVRVAGDPQVIRSDSDDTKRPRPGKTATNTKGATGTPVDKYPGEA